MERIQAANERHASS